jgi:two-component system sensor histidine kinase TctE
MTSLRARLLAWLLPLLLVVGVAAAAGAYVFMERRLTAAYDLDLADIARALVPHLRERGGQVSLELTPLADAVLRADSTDRIFYAVHDAGGRVVAGERTLESAPTLRARDSRPHFWDTRRGGEPLRAVAIDAEVGGTPVTVIAMETTHKRERATRDALLSSIAPVVLLLTSAAIATILGVRRGLGPMDRLTDEVKTRSHMDLRAVDESRVADELLPLVRALNAMLARLSEAQTTQARLIANAAHQLRTPIAGLVTQLELAKTDGAGREAHLAHAREGATRLARLAQQLLSLAAADPISNPNARDEPLDLAEIVKSRADRWTRSAIARGVELEFDLAPAPAQGIPLLVGELAENLVDNASRYGARSVRIVTRRDAADSIVEVADDGPGIPAAERERIFERFHRADNEATEGSGLGLAIVREIAQRHHAAIAVHDAPGSTGVIVRVAFRATVLAFLVLVAPLPPAHAARPMITDDARMVDAKACQVESWARRGRDATEYWALPACNPLGSFELTIGGAATHEEGTTRFTQQQLQVKTLFRPYEPGGWGIGLSVGAIRHARREVAGGWPGDRYFYVPFSIAAGSDDWVVHANLGAVHRRDEQRTVLTWGFGNEIRMTPRAYFIPEVFRSESGRPFYQAGVRYWVVPDRLQMDATFGNRLGSSTREHWVSVGFRLLSAPFLP